MRRVRTFYSGRVQGVGFRATARAVAAGHPVTGWVRNEHDGRVLLEVQGPAPAVDAFLADLRRRMGRTIDAESHSEVPPADGERTFEIRP